MVVLFSFFSSRSSSSRALLRDLVVLVAAQFAVRIGNGFRRIIIRRRRLVRPHLSKLLCVYMLLFNAFSVFFFYCCSPFKESMCEYSSFASLFLMTFPHFSISPNVRLWIGFTTRERETTDDDGLTPAFSLSEATSKQREDENDENNETLY